MKQLDLGFHPKAKARISRGNRKLGKKVPNVSLVPIKDCPNCTFCRKDCYAMKGWRQYPNVKAAWKHNSDAVRSAARVDWFTSINNYIQKRQLKYFRWHVGGDILDQNYYDWMCTVARENPKTKFLCFTKNRDIKFLNRPENLAIVLSMWPGMRVPKNKMPRAWFRDKAGKEKRIPKDAILCPGSCDECKICWNLPARKRDIIFRQH